MGNNYYPVLSPNVSFSYLNEEMSLLTHLNNFNTKLINQYQSLIIELCNGRNSINIIINKLSKEYPKIYTKTAVEKFLNKMLQKGFLQISPVDIEVDIFSLRFKHYEEKNYFNPSQLHTVTISITESCCMKCGHCSQSAPFGKGKQMSFKQIQMILNDAYNLGARYFGVFGGEPLLHPDIFNIVKYAYHIGYRDVIIFTKGTLITNEKAKILKSIGVNTIQVSCDSHIPSKYDKIVKQKDAFKKFFQGIYSILNAGITIQLKVVITNKNINDALDLIEFFILNGITNIAMEVVVPVGRADFKYLPSSEEIYDLDTKIIKLKKDNKEKYRNVTFKYCEYGKAKSCSGGISSLMIFVDGTVSPCDKSYEYKDILNFGNVFENSLYEIWENGNFGRFRNLSNDLICKECKDNIECRGGCPLNSLIMNAKLSDSDIMCSKISGKNKGILFID